jgi:hypothetical protein
MEKLVHVLSAERVHIPDAQLDNYATSALRSRGSGYDRCWHKVDMSHV